SLPEGKVWERDRAYFLRDLFIQKVFKEKGLVTRASDTKKLQRRRKLAVMVTGFIGVFVLLGLTWFGARTLDKNIGVQREYWTGAKSEYLDNTDKWRWQLFSSDGKTVKYLGDSEMRGPVGKIPRGKFHADTYDMMQSRIDVPWIFKPLAAFSGDINLKRNTAYREMYEESVLRPLMDAVRTKIRSETPEHWSDSATAALAQLIRIETYASKAAPASNAANPDEPKINLEPLARYVLENNEEFNSFRGKYGKVLQASVDWLYKKDGGGGDWPATGLSAGAGNNGLAAINDGVKTFNDYWARQIEGRSARLQAIRNLVDSLDKYRRAEEEVATATKKMPEKMEEYNNIRDIWNERYKTMQQAKADADVACASLEKDPGWPDGTPLASVFSKEVDRIIADATKAHQALMNHLPADEKAKSSVDGVRSTLKEALGKVPNLRALAEAYPNQNKLPDLDRLYLAKGQDLFKKQSRRYAIHHQLYKLADDQMTAPRPAGDFKFNTIAGGLQKIDTDVVDNVIRPAEALPSGFTIDRELIDRACNSAKAVSEIAARSKRQQLLDLTLSNAPTDAQQVEQLVAGAAQGTLSYGKIALTKWSAGGAFDRIYNPAAAAEYLQGWKAIGNQLPDPRTQAGSRVVEAAPLLKKYDGTRGPVNDYLKHYLDYWTRNVRDKLTIAIPSWRSFFTSQDTTVGWQEEAYSEIIKINGTVREALDLVSKNLPQDAALQKAFDDAIAAAKPLDKELLETIQINYNKLARNWRSLGSDPDKARDVLLEMTPGKFQDEFLVLRRPNQPIVQKYISDFGYEMLRLLSDESKNVATLALKQLKTLSRFPLAKPDDSPVLTVEEVAKARAMISKITIHTRVANPTVTTKIGEGGTTKID
ncbi:MAG TPA: hypothetical protein VGP94_03495, partial [Tepidisphaeraceae bacterium]|nr:hypothetical protein [Tepidisphaeraceae bacterium]